LKKIKCLIILLTLLRVIPSIALGNEFGGGFVTEKNGKMWLFDFYEHSIESPNLNEFPDEEKFEEKFKTSDLPSDLKAHVIWKLNEISSVSPEFAKHLANLFVQFRWRFVDLELKRIEDVGPSLVDLKTVVLTPIALRSSSTHSIYISKKDFELLPEIHKIGLIFHEVVGAYFDQSRVENFWGGDSSRSRKIVAELFRKNFTFEKLKSAFAATNHLIFQENLTKYFRYTSLFYWNTKAEDVRFGIGINSFIYQEKKSFLENLKSCPTFVIETENNFNHLKRLGLDFIATTHKFYEQVRSNLNNDQYLELPKTEYDPYLKIGFASGKSYSHPFEAQSVYIKCTKNPYYCLNGEKFSVEWQSYFDYQRLSELQNEFSNRYSQMNLNGRNKCDWSRIPNYPNEYHSLRYANPKSSWR